MPKRVLTLRELNRATLMIKPFEPLLKKERDALLEEGERLVRFVGDCAEAYEVRFVEEV